MYLPLQVISTYCMGTGHWWAEPHHPVTFQRMTSSHTSSVFRTPPPNQPPLTFPRCDGKGISDFWKVGVLTLSPRNSQDTLASSERLLIEKGEESPPDGCDRRPEGEGRALTGAGRPRRSFRQGFLLPYPS